MILHQSDEYLIESEGGKVYIQVFKESSSLHQVNELFSEHPRIYNINFMKLRNTFLIADGEKVDFAETRDAVEISISPDKTSATLKLYITKDEFENNRKELNKEINKKIEEKGIVFGVKAEIFSEDFDYSKEQILAEAVLPENGKDAEVTYIDIPNAKPEVDKKGAVDFYSVELYKTVTAGDWVGTMVLPTDGKEGMTIFGEPLHSKKGKGSRLRYDPKTIQLIEEEEQHVLSAKVSGIVEFKGGKLSITEHLMISGDVNYSTGNIDFKGFLTIKGTIEDGFSVKADYDISVLGEMGLGMVKSIESRHGSVFLKGGIYGRNKSVVKAKKNIFVKYANEVKLSCEGEINIGYYALNAVLESNSLTVAASNGRILGGNAQLIARLEAQYVGNNKEIRTDINISGFERKKINEELTEVLNEYKEKLKLMEYNKKALEVIENGEGQNVPIEYKKLKLLIDKLLSEIAALEDKRARLTDMLTARGEGSVLIKGQMYRGVSLRIKGQLLRLEEDTINGSVYYENGEIKWEQR